ncbi:MAG: competence/damage-inducible protein A [Armatimonadota bacterium]
MIAEVVSIGTELLLGQIVDTDAAFLARALGDAGVSVFHRTTVGDNPERMAAVLRQALGRADLVVCVGGLGPTVDDLTREMIAGVSGRPLRRDPALVAALEARYAARGRVAPATVMAQADVPEGGESIPNPHGTAPGIWLEVDGKVVVACPGPPAEFEPMVLEQVMPRLRARLGVSAQVIRSKVLRVAGMGEAEAEPLLRDLMDGANPTLAPYAKPAEVHFRITARAADAGAADALIAPIAAEVRARLGEVVYGEDTEDLETAVVGLLRAKGRTVSTAESCTGGLLAGRFTAVPGSSEVFGTGLVTYANAAKRRLLQVPPAVLAQFGAVSEPVADAMASRVRELAGADYGIGITGIAGPGGGSADKPVGLVYIGLAGPGGTVVARHVFGGSRDMVRLRSTQAALVALRLALLREG